MNRNTYEGLCESVEVARGCAERACALPAFCLLRAMLGPTRAHGICQQLCQLYSQGDFTEGVLMQPLARVASERWGSVPASGRTRSRPPVPATECPVPARPRSLAQTTHEALCDSVEHARGCVRQASSMPPFCLLRAMVGNASARRVCQQLCRLYLQGVFDGSLTKPLEWLARRRWPQPRPVTQKGAVRP